MRDTQQGRNQELVLRYNVPDTTEIKYEHKTCPFLYLFFTMNLISNRFSPSINKIANLKETEVINGFEAQLFNDIMISLQVRTVLTAVKIK